MFPVCCEFIEADSSEQLNMLTDGLIASTFGGEFTYTLPSEVNEQARRVALATMLATFKPHAIRFAASGFDYYAVRLLEAAARLCDDSVITLGFNGKSAFNAQYLSVPPEVTNNVDIMHGNTNSDYSENIKSRAQSARDFSKLCELKRFGCGTLEAFSNSLDGTMWKRVADSLKFTEVAK
ncbi:hypothetical protein ACLD55_01295 [Gardnerella vaginalis]|uniref:hypothetical protein n=1 Tax=Gardnerella vaginalis TaxID=2702 RepID=UPI003970B9CE